MLLRKFIVIGNQFISIETVCSSSNSTAACTTKLSVFNFTLTYDAVSFRRRITCKIIFFPPINLLTLLFVSVKQK